MDYESLKFVMMEQTKSSYYVIKAILDNMTREEYEHIPILALSEEQLSFVKTYAVCDIPLEENDNFLNNKPFFELYYVAPTLFRVLNENKKITP